MANVIVIGGGPAGMMAAITAAEYGNNVTIIEKNSDFGKKLLITGKGRCNITSSLEMSEFIKNTPGNGQFLYSAFQNYTNTDIIDFLKNQGLEVKEERGNRIFPVTDHSQDVLKCFTKKLKENNLKGHLRNNSIIMCQMIFTSDQVFFDKIGEKETKRYFDECYKFICNYKNLGEKNIISAVVHLDEGAPHMHLMFVPVVHTKDKDGNDIDKICARDFWKGRDSYRKLQDAYFNHVKSKGFDLERGMFVEDTDRKHYTVEEYKKITNYENTKKVLKEIKLEIPEVPNINEISKFSIKRDEKILKEIIKPKDDLIKELYKNNL